MKKTFVRLFLLLLVAAAVAQQQLPPELSGRISKVYGTALSDDGEWCFVNVSTSEAESVLYSVNLKSGEYFKVFEDAEKCNKNIISTIYFYPKTQKLYFIINNGDYYKNNVQIFCGYGIYTVQKDEAGNYSSAGLKRYATPMSWLMERLRRAYLEKSGGADVRGFLDYLYAFADAGTKPVLGIQTDGGTFVYDEAAINYLVQNNALEDFISEKARNQMFLLEKYLFACDESGAPTSKTAFTNNGSKTFHSCERIGLSESYFVQANDTLYFIIETGSMKNDGEGSETWSYDYSRVYEIKEDGVDFSFATPKGLEGVKAIPYIEGKNVPISAAENGLLISDVDGKTKWLYTTSGLEKLSEGVPAPKGGAFRSAKAALETPAARILLALCIFLLVCALALSALLVQLLFGRPTKRQRAFACKIQEEEKQKIAKDIHDTIVQDIRAIRIDAEMLLVAEESRQKKNELVEKITQCIVKMRNICYGLAPAELSLADDVDFLSIADTLCTQFTTQTNIPCRLNIDGEIKAAMLPKGKCENLVRIIQEAFRNIEKHSYATEAQLLFREECDPKSPAGKILNIFIIDDGRGCDLKEVLGGKSSRLHFGLRSMKERAQMIGAELSFRSEKGDGMQIKVKMSL